MHWSLIKILPECSTCLAFPLSLIKNRSAGGLGISHKRRLVYLVLHLGQRRGQLCGPSWLVWEASSLWTSLLSVPSAADALIWCFLWAEDTREEQAKKQHQLLKHFLVKIKKCQLAEKQIMWPPPQSDVKTRGLLAQISLFMQLLTQLSPLWKTAHTISVYDSDRPIKLGFIYLRTRPYRANHVQLEAVLLAHMVGYLHWIYTGYVLE